MQWLQKFMMGRYGADQLNLALIVLALVLSIVFSIVPLGLIGTLIAMIPLVLAVVLSKTALGSAGIWCAWPVGWTVATFLSVLFYKQGYWNRMQETV